MTQQDERDHAEEDYLRRLCPACNHSPCISGDHGGCTDRDEALTPEEIADLGHIEEAAR